MKLTWATATDAAAMARAHAGAFDAPWREEDFEDLLDGEGVFGFVAHDAEAPVGVILCRVAADEMEVLTIGVASAARRKGVAKALMEAALGAAGQAGARACHLEVAVDNDAAAALYAGLGFRRAGLRKRYYDRGAAGQVDALVMRRDLNGAAA
jgi:ribosomal-protein-alanine N-acetyltransferase